MVGSLFLDSELDPSSVNIFNDELLIMIIRFVKLLNDVDALFFILVLQRKLIFYDHICVAVLGTERRINNNVFIIR